MLAVKMSFPRLQTERMYLVQNLGYFFITRHAFEILLL